MSASSSSMFERGQPALPSCAMRIIIPYNGSVRFSAGRASELNLANNTIVWSGSGPHDVPVSARHDGFVFFEFDKSDKYSGGEIAPYKVEIRQPFPKELTEERNLKEQLIHQRVDYMNALLICLYSAFTTVDNISPVVQEAVTPNNWHLCTRNDETLNPAPNPFTQQNIQQSKFIFSLETLDFALKTMDTHHQILGVEFSSVLALLLSAIDHYNQHQFASSHLLSWSIIEKLLNLMWANLQHELSIQNGGHTNINKDRSKLLNGRDFTASIVSQCLSLSGKISDPLLQRVDITRRKRNGFAHNLDSVSSSDAGSAISVASDLLGQLTGERLKYGLVLASIDVGYR